MRPFSRRIVSCFMLGIFMLSLGTHIFNTNWLTHDLNAGHSSNTYGKLPDLPQAKLDGYVKYAGPGSTSGSLSNAVHKLLHSADPAQPLLVAAIADGLHDVSFWTIRFPVRSGAIFPADPEPPFRPPIASYRA